MAGRGQPKTGGRKQGTPNRTSAALREAILEALDLAGGPDYLVRVAESDPATFLRLLARVLPSAVQAEVTATADAGQELMAAIRAGRERARPRRAGDRR